jgi:hypothetical protein
METLVRNVRDLDESDRSALERVLGHQLRESQRLVIQVMSVPLGQPAATRLAGDELPAWCDMYEGLSESEIDNLDASIVRTHSPPRAGGREKDKGGFVADTPVAVQSPVRRRQAP